MVSVDWKPQELDAAIWAKKMHPDARVAIYNLPYAAEAREELGVKVKDEAGWIQLGPLTGYQPIAGLVSTRQYVYLHLNGQQVTVASGDGDEEIRNVSLKSASELTVLDDENGFQDPFSPYILWKAVRWIKKHKPDLYPKVVPEGCLI